jgi:hypothetical protein
MNQSSDSILQQRIAALEAENARLRQTLDMVKAERKELRERVYGPFPEASRISEAEMAEIVKNLVPGEGMKFFAEMGLLPENELYSTVNANLAGPGRALRSPTPAAVWGPRGRRPTVFVLTHQYGQDLAC